MAQHDPQSWHVEVPRDHIDLYEELRETPRGLDPKEAEMMVELVDAWRALEHRKHIALEACLGGEDHPRQT